MKTNFNKVNEFNECFGHFLSDKEFHTIFDENPKLVELKYSLINEECGELTEAIGGNDLKEIVDALSDIKYVVYGFGGAFGINIDIEYRDFCYIENKNLNVLSKKMLYTINSGKSPLNIDNIPWCKYSINLDTILGDNSLSNYQLVNHINTKYFNTTSRPSTLNNIDWNASNFYGQMKYEYDVMDFYKNLNNKTYRHLIYNIWGTINILNNNLKIEIDNKHFENIKKILVKLLYAVNTLGIIIGVDLDRSFDIVHNSNMTKICKNREEAQQTVSWYIKNDRRYNSPSYKENKYGFVIFNEDTGKILKSINYTPANFDSILPVYNKDKNIEYNIKNIWFPGEFRNK